MRRFAAVPMTATVALIAACSFDLPVESPPLDFAICTSSTQCSGRTVCEVGFCVADTNTKELIHIQVVPPSSSDLVAEQFISVELEQGEPLPDLHMQRPATLVGAVTRRDQEELAESEKIQVAARIVARRTYPTIEGLPLRFEAKAPANVDIGRDHGFILRLPVGRYDVTMLPLDPVHPLEIAVDVSVEGDTKLPFIVEWLVSNPESGDVLDTRTLIHGWVVYTEEGGELAGAELPVGGAKVTAIDDIGRSASTTATTEIDGSFTISLRKDVNAVRMVVESPENTLLPRALFAREVRPEVPLSLALGSIDTLGATQSGGEPPNPNVHGKVIGGNGEAIPNATVHFVGDVGVGTWSGSAKTDEEGRFEKLMPNTRYSVLINPPADSVHAVTELSDVILIGGSPTLVARRKVEISGRALDPSATRPVEDVVLRFRRIQRSSFDQLREFTANTNFRGYYSLHVDPGWYEIEVIAPMASGYARSRVVPPAWNRDLNKNFTTSLPNVAYGKVFDDDGSPVAGAAVEIFRTIPELGVRSVATGRTDESGSYRMLVPEIGVY